jgi:hypothetical protein
MNGLRGAVQAKRLLEFFERAVRLALHFASEALAMLGFQPRLASGPMMQRREGSHPLALAEQLFDESERHAEARRHRLPRAFRAVIHRQNPLS